MKFILELANNVSEMASQLILILTTTESKNKTYIRPIICQAQFRLWKALSIVLQMAKVTLNMEILIRMFKTKVL